MNDGHIDFHFLETNLRRLKNEYISAIPFEHVIVDGFLKPSSLVELHKEIALPIDSNRSNDYLFAKNKFENPAFADQGGIMAEIKEELLSIRFAHILSEIAGIQLFVDPTFLGGGIHQGGEGSFLDMHADFNRHPVESNWLRTINILLYLNPTYKESYGGHLELVNAKSGSSGRISPLDNRLVLMLTKEHTLHGYKRINFPAGLYRTSLAAYAYQLDDNFADLPARTTSWKPTNAGVLKRMIAHLSPWLVRAKNRLLGSGTERRARRAKHR